MPRPKFKPSIGLAPVANGFLGYDPELDLVHELPPLVGFAAELADGSRTRGGNHSAARPAAARGKPRRPFQPGSPRGTNPACSWTASPRRRTGLMPAN